MNLPDCTSVTIPAMGHPRADSLHALLAELGFDPSATSIQELGGRHGHVLYRLRSSCRSYVLKYFPGGDPALEVQAYELFNGSDVDTIPLVEVKSNALLLEDLAESSEWRLAVADDMRNPLVGAAIARWYLGLHNAGRHLIQLGRCPAGVKSEYENLSSGRIRETGLRLNLNHLSVWRRAVDVVGEIVGAISDLPQTLTYNDFHFSNLAIFGSTSSEVRCVMFDYHLLGLGPTVSDYRNVVEGLKGDAQKAFRETYGAPGAREVYLDAPLAVLSALCAVEIDSPIPRWARELCIEVGDGTLDKKLSKALESVRP